MARILRSNQFLTYSGTAPSRFRESAHLPNDDAILDEQHSIPESRRRLKKYFPGYYQPDSDELKVIWDSGLVILDTNALLNLFRYTPKTRDDFVTVLRGIEHQLWLPHQVGAEFHRRRLDVVQQQTEAYTEVRNAVESAKQAVVKVLNKYRRHPSLNVEEFEASLNAKVLELGAVLDQSASEHQESVLSEGRFDETFKQIADLYEERVGEPYTPEELSLVFEEGKLRYESKIPPGYKDGDKPEPDRYGDLVLWKQILSETTARPRPAIFVTDDSKDDWWYRTSGKTHGPRVELVDEYFRATGQRIHFYTPDRFLGLAKERLGSTISDASLSEVQEVSSQRAKHAIEQLEARRVGLENQHTRLSHQLMRIADGRSPSSFENRRLIEVQQELEKLHHKILDNSTKQAKMRAQIELAEHDVKEREHCIYQLGHLEAEERHLHDQIDDAAERLNRLSRTHNRRADVDGAHQLREQIGGLEEQLRQIDLALGELSRSRS